MTEPAAAPPTQPLTRLAAPLAMLLVVWALSAMAPSTIADSAAAPWTWAARRGLDSAAWLAAAWLAIRLIDALIWERLVTRLARVRMPGLLRQLVAALLFIIVGAAMLNQVWGVAIAAVVATTGVLGLVLGLALRPILSDLFCGIALNIEQPFRLNDFVLLRPPGQRDAIMGTVREINWRSTRVLTPEDNLISVPNSMVALAVVENLSFPSPVSEQEIDIALDWQADTALAEAVLQAAVTEAWALGAAAGDKPPKVRMSRLDGSGVTYKIVYLLDPRRKPKGPAKHALLGCVRKHLLHAGLRPATVGVPMLAAAAPSPSAFDARREADRARLIAAVPLFAPLDDDERARLAGAARVRLLEAGATVVSAGEPGGSMFIVAAGVLEVLIAEASNDGAPRRVAVLGPGDVFGEMSMLTGAPRSASVRALSPATLCEIEHPAFAPLLAARPVLAEALSSVVAEHQRRDAARRELEAGASTSPAPTRGLAEQIAERIRRFFAGG